VLEDEAGEELLSAKGRTSLHIQLHRALPLPLLVMVTLRIVDELSSTMEGNS
jgi:hypothetical protein